MNLHKPDHFNENLVLTTTPEFYTILFSFLVSLYIMLALFCVQESGQIRVLYNFNVINLSLLDKILRSF